MTSTVIFQFLESPVAGVLTFPKNQSGPGLLLLPAWWGLNEFFKGLAKRLAGEGFITFAPDYYNGQVATSVETAKALSGQLDRKEAEKQVKMAAEFMKSHPAVDGEKIGIIGFSLGVRFAMNLARTKAKDVGAVVLFYGVAGGLFREFTIPVQGHFAENDEWGSGPEAMQKLRTRLAAGRGVIDFHEYPHTSHWFFEEDVKDAYNAAAASLANKRMLSFLREWLKKEQPESL
ncbi:MAG: dienelactone hydrolase family protein [Promethearchaeota archaeon]